MGNRLSTNNARKVVLQSSTSTPHTTATPTRLSQPPFAPTHHHQTTTTFNHTSTSHSHTNNNNNSTNRANNREIRKHVQYSDNDQLFMEHQMSEEDVKMMNKLKSDPHAAQLELEQLNQRYRNEYEQELSISSSQHEHPQSSSMSSGSGSGTSREESVLSQINSGAMNHLLGSTTTTTNTTNSTIHHHQSSTTATTTTTTTKRRVYNQDTKDRVIASSSSSSSSLASTIVGHHHDDDDESNVVRQPQPHEQTSEATQDKTQAETEEEEEEEYTIEFLNNLQKLSNNIQSSSIPFTPNAFLQHHHQQSSSLSSSSSSSSAGQEQQNWEYQLGRAKARPLNHPLSNNSNNNNSNNNSRRIHLETQLERNEKYGTSAPLDYYSSSFESSSSSISSRSSGQQQLEFEGTFTPKQIKRLFDIMREKKFRMENNKNNNGGGVGGSTTTVDEQTVALKAQMFQEFCSVHQLDKQRLDSIAQYVNSPYIVRATKHFAFGLWNKPNLSHHIWKQSSSSQEQQE